MISSLAPIRSPTFAAVTTTASRNPSTSTAMCRFRPLIFLPLSKPRVAAPTVSAPLTDCESTTRCGGLRVAAHPNPQPAAQPLHEALGQASLVPPLEERV